MNGVEQAQSRATTAAAIGCFLKLLAMLCDAMVLLGPRNDAVGLTVRNVRELYSRTSQQPKRLLFLLSFKKQPSLTVPSKSVASLLIATLLTCVLCTITTASAKTMMSMSAPAAENLREHPMEGATAAAAATSQCSSRSSYFVPLSARLPAAAALLVLGENQQQQQQQQTYSATSYSRHNTNAVFACLYTKQKTQKRKKWQDGRLVLRGCSVALHAAAPASGLGRSRPRSVRRTVADRSGGCNQRTAQRFGTGKAPGHRGRSVDRRRHGGGNNSRGKDGSTPPLPRHEKVAHPQVSQTREHGTSAATAFQPTRGSGQTATSVATGRAGAALLRRSRKSSSATRRNQQQYAGSTNHPQQQ